MKLYYYHIRLRKGEQDLNFTALAKNYAHANVFAKEYARIFDLGHRHLCDIEKTDRFEVLN